MDAGLVQLRARLGRIMERHDGVMRLGKEADCLPFEVDAIRERLSLSRDALAQALSITRNQLDYLLTRAKGERVTFTRVEVEPSGLPVILVLPNDVRVECSDVRLGVDFARQWG